MSNKRRLDRLERIVPGPTSDLIRAALGPHAARPLDDVPDEDLFALAERGKPGPILRKRIGTLRRSKVAPQLRDLAAKLRVRQPAELEDCEMLLLLAFPEGR